MERDEIYKTLSKACQDESINAIRVGAPDFVRVCPKCNSREVEYELTNACLQTYQNPHTNKIPLSRLGVAARTRCLSCGHEVVQCGIGTHPKELEGLMGIPKPITKKKLWARRITKLLTLLSLYAGLEFLALDIKLSLPEIKAAYAAMLTISAIGMIWLWDTSDKVKR